MSKPFCAHATLTEPTPALPNILLAITSQLTKNSRKEHLPRVAPSRGGKRDIATTSKKNNTSLTQPSTSVTLLWPAKSYTKSRHQQHPIPKTLSRQLTAIPQLSPLLMGQPDYDFQEPKAKTCAPDLEKNASCPYIGKMRQQTQSVNFTEVGGVTTNRSPLC
jgi:hypothetical protein